MSRITPSTESKILEEFIVDLWKISRWISAGDNSPELILFGLLWSCAREESKVSMRWRRGEAARRRHGVKVKVAGGW
jgi:hypothetical protein